MTLYRFYITKNGLTWYLMDDRQSFTTHRHSAELYTEADWQGWADEQDFEREPLGEDELIPQGDTKRSAAGRSAEAAGV